jgi:hypothetical protein
VASLRVGLNDGEEPQNEIRGFQGPGDFLFPQLTRKEVFFIQPRLEPLIFKAVIDIPNLRFVFVGMTERNASHSLYLQHGIHMSHISK